MELRFLTEAQMKEIYNKHMVEDFPSDELKPFGIISELVSRKLYFAYGLYEDDRLFAYAFLCRSENGRYILLDYFAVTGGKRGLGIGGHFLDVLKMECSDYEGMFIEVENAGYAKDEEERLIRLRRIDFYRRNGVLDTDVCCRLFGVEMNIMFMELKSAGKDITLSDGNRFNKGLTDDDSSILNGFEAVYKSMLEDRGLMHKVIIYRDGE